MCLCVHKSIKTRTDTDAKVQQPNEYLVSLLLVSVQTPLVYEGSPPAFDAVAQGRIEMERCYNRLASFVLPLLTHTHTLTCCTSWSSFLRHASWSWYWDLCWCC